MTGKDNKIGPEFAEPLDDAIVFDIDAASSISSAEMIRRPEASGPQQIDPPVAVEEIAVEEAAETSAAFKELALPKLPELQKENRARLLMQSPTRIFFYWSLKKNPYQVLHRLFGENTGSYSLVLKLINIASGYEELHEVEAEGFWWFNVEPDSHYRAEIGLYAPNRPYIRVIFSNAIATPRKSPSPRRSAFADWTVSADRFARVLDVSGFKQDAFKVALTGDEETASENFSSARFAGLIGCEETEVSGISAEEIRFSILALAAGMPLEYLKWKISPALFAMLQANIGKLAGNEHLAEVCERFGIADDEFEFEESEPAVFGASLVNFPKRVKYKQSLLKYAPVSSFSIGLKN